MDILNQTVIYEPIGEFCFGYLVMSINETYLKNNNKKAINLKKIIDLLNKELKNNHVIEYSLINN